VKFIFTIIAKTVVFIWDFIFFFFGFPYEKQAEKLDLDKYDGMIRGPDNEKSTRTFFRANKVSNDKEYKDS
jgi:hypothetical protein